MEHERHEIQIVASSLEDVKQLLSTAEPLSAGREVDLGEGMRLEVSDVSKSSGFDVASLIVTGVVTVLTSTSTALLIEWAKSKLFKPGAKAGANVSIIIDGKEIKIGDTSATP